MIISNIAKGKNTYIDDLYTIRVVYTPGTEETMTINFKQYCHLAKHCSKHIKLLIVLMIVVIILVNIVAYQMFNTQLEKLFDKETDIYLDELSSRSADSVKQKVNGDINKLRGISVMLGAQDRIKMDDWMKVLKNHEFLKEFQSIYIIFPNGKGYRQDGHGINFSNQDYFKRAMKGEVVILNGTSHFSAITYAVPIFKEGKVIAILSAVIDRNVFENVLSFSTFNGKGSSYILNKDGRLIVQSNQQDKSMSDYNIFSNIEKTNTEKPNKDVDSMKKNMLAGKNGEVYYTIDGANKEAVYERIGINDWYLLTNIPVNVTAYKTKTIAAMTVILSILVTLVLLAFLGYVVFEQNKHRKRLFQLAYMDEVTGALNKNSFKLEADLLIKKGKSRYAFIMMDIDKFKIINDIFGYPVGDLLLKHITKVWFKHLNQNERFARISADKFYVLMEWTTQENFEIRLQRIIDDITYFEIIRDSHFNMVVCAGIYVIENVDITIDAMSDRANLASRKIKGRHSSAYFFYDDDLRNGLIEQSEIENDMNKALENKEFKVYVQPKYDLKTEKVSGGEALIRWQHPQKGFILPDRFIPIFENNGFVTKVDMFVVEEICKKQKQWIEQGHLPQTIAINQSRLHLYNSNYVNDLKAITEKYHIDPKLLELELTESAVFDNLDVFLDVTNRLRDFGYRLSIDDFGTGYSSLNMLKDIVVDTLKLDRGFFSDTIHVNRSIKITENIIKMAKDLNMKTVAEGVETKEQVEFLRKLDCNLVQGYYYAKPMPLDDFYQLLINEEIRYHSQY